MTSIKVDIIILAFAGNIFHKKNPPFIDKTTDNQTFILIITAVSF